MCALTQFPLRGLAVFLVKAQHISLDANITEPHAEFLCSWSFIRSAQLKDLNAHSVRCKPEICQLPCHERRCNLTRLEELMEGLEVQNEAARYLSSFLCPADKV